MNVNFYQYQRKRINSTLRPTGSGTVYNCNLKEGCDLLNPVFILDLASMPTSLTYCYAFSRYYFISKWVNVSNRIWECHCSIDVLATYKSDIGNYVAFVERASSSYDTLITDNYITASNNISNMATTTVNMPTAPGDIYMVPVFGRNGVRQYIFPDITDASVFFNTGTTMTVNGQSVTPSDWINAIKNAGWVFAGSDVTSYMGDMVYMPYLPPVATPYITTTDIAFGFTTLTSPTSVNVLDPDNNYYKFTDTLTDPGNIYSDFRAYDSRFSQYKIYLPGCGVYDINAADAGKKDLKIDVTMDWLTTAVTYRIYHDGGSTVAMFEGKFGSGVPAMGAKLDVFGLLQDTATGAAAMMNDNFGAAAGSVISAAKKVSEPQVNARSAGAGNGATLKNFPHILFNVKNFESKDIPTSVAGRPLYKNVTLSSLSGYVKCGNASVSIYGYETEKEMVNNFLNSGFYYE